MRGTSRVNSKVCCCEKAKSKGTHIGHEASVLAFADGSAGVLLRAPTLCGVSLRIVGAFQTTFYLVGGPGGHARAPPRSYLTRTCGQLESATRNGDRGDNAGTKPVPPSRKADRLGSCPLSTFAGFFFLLFFRI